MTIHIVLYFTQCRTCIYRANSLLIGPPLKSVLMSANVLTVGVEMAGPALSQFYLIRTRVPNNLKIIN